MQNTAKEVDRIAQKRITRAISQGGKEVERLVPYIKLPFVGLVTLINRNTTPS